MLLWTFSWINFAQFNLFIILFYSTSAYKPKVVLISGFWWNTREHKKVFNFFLSVQKMVNTFGLLCCRIYFFRRRERKNMNLPRSCKNFHPLLIKKKTETEKRFLHRSCCFFVVVVLMFEIFQLFTTDLLLAFLLILRLVLHFCYPLRTF